MNQEERQAAWAAACQQWLDVSLPHLAAHARQMAKGERGVLVVSVDADEVTRVLALAASPDATVLVGLVPTWLPADEFIEIIKDHHEDREAWRRWGSVIEAMEPTRDLALYLHSEAEDNPAGITFSRFLFLSDWPKDA